MILSEPEAPAPRIAHPDDWAVRGGTIELCAPVLMGILNVTPDSFSGDGIHGDPGAAIIQAREMVEAGAAIIDVGGESTRPGARPVSPDEETTRILPVIQALVASGFTVSVDTRRAAVARAVLREGVHIINDVSALGDPEMGSVLAESDAGLVLMHMRGTPETMQRDPAYDDVVREVAAELGRALARAEDAGIGRERIVLDPGIGFGKTARHNLELLNGLGELRDLDRPILLGVSRKAFLGAILGAAPPEERVVGTVAACVAGYLAGARIFRVHDVRPVREALDVAHAISTAAPHVS